MSIHVRSTWGGTSDPSPDAVDAVLVALQANHDRRGTVWTPAVWVVFSPADAVMFLAAQILDICGKKPTPRELAMAVLGVPVDRRRVVYTFLSEVFHKLEIPGD